MELVVGADPERERQARRRATSEPTIRPTPARWLALGVQAGLPEDEHGHEREERQPVRLGAPEHAPEDRVGAVVELAEDERRVEPERQPAEVEQDERGDARDPAEERAEGLAERSQGRPERMSPTLGAGGGGRSADAGRTAGFVATPELYCPVLSEVL